jgi:dolichol-phosphate mannosyltransferase
MWSQAVDSLFCINREGEMIFNRAEGNDRKGDNRLSNKIIVIIPTYNERGNIGLLINSLQKEFQKLPYEMHILIVDDNSPDGTAEYVKNETKKYTNIHLITGEKQGLGSAYIRGMKYAVGVLNADAVMEMDADFSHKPEDIHRLTSALEHGADFVIGSRYTKGGKIPDNWGFVRKMNSRCGNIFARYIAGLYKIHDCTAGFRAIRASVIKKINLENLRVQGYTFQMALLHRAIVSGAVVQEIPVEFVDRVRGQTKLGFSDIFEFIINAWWIRFESSKTFIKFAMVGASGVFVNLGIFTILINLGLNKYAASPIAIECSIISNFIFNNFWTFAHRNNKDKLHLKGLKFNFVSFIALGVSYLSFILLTLRYPNIIPQVHQAIGIIPGTFTNYFLNSYRTFKKNTDEAKNHVKSEEENISCDSVGKKRFRSLTSRTME